ncbi:MAG TPA: hypothetical protein VKY31_15735 [Terriglobia bacterium]|nr:hypothetical protein [Terriglobia bacterium]
MSMHRKIVGIALGASLLLAGAAYAGAEPFDRHPEQQERVARDEIHRGETMEQEGHRLERAGEWRRGEALERRGENLERHGRQMLNEAERHEHEWRR